MAYSTPALVGTIGAVSTGAASAAVTPAWGTSENRTANNLLILQVAVTGSATLPTAPSGWSGANALAGTSCSASIYYKVATGADAAPTIAAITSGTINARLSEYSGLTITNPQSTSGSAAGTTTPQKATNAAVDITSPALMVSAVALLNSSARTVATFTETYTNGTSISVNNAATSTVSHYGFSYANTTAHAVADADSFAFTTTQVTGVAVSLASFIPFYTGVATGAVAGTFTGTATGLVTVAATASASGVFTAVATGLTTVGAFSIISQPAVTGGSPLSGASFTPVAGAVLMVAYFGFANAIGTATIADTFGDTGGGAWTAFTGSSFTTSGTFASPWGGWYRIIGTSPHAGAVTVTVSGWTGGASNICVDQFIPVTGALIVPQTKANAASFSATGSVVLPSAPASTSVVWSGGGTGAAAMTPVVTTAGFSQLGLVNNGLSTSAASAFISGSGPTTTAWSGLNAGQISALFAAEVAKVTVSPGTGTATGTFTSTATGVVIPTLAATGTAIGTFTGTATGLVTVPATGTMAGTFTASATGVSAIPAGPSVYANAVMADGPVFYWRLDEATGTSAADATGNGLVGTYATGTVLGDSPAVADGTSVGVVLGHAEGVSIPTFPAAQTYPFSIEMWVNVSYIAYWGTLFAKVVNTGWGSGFGCFSMGDPTFRFWTTGYGTGITFSLPMAPAPGNWAHLVLTFDGTTGNIYLDGALAGSGPLSPSGLSNAASLWFGQDGGGYDWQGFMDEIAFYGYVLSPTQVATHYTAGAGGTFVTSVTPGTVRNGDFPGYVGMVITTGSAPLTVTALGRWVLSGNTGTHTVAIYTPSGTTPVASVTIDTTKAAAYNAYEYAQVTPAVILSAGTTYYVVSQEFDPGDSWLNSNTVLTTTADASVSSGIYGNPPSWGGDAGANNSFVPVDFKYLIAPTVTTVPGSGSLSGVFTATATGTVVFPSTAAMAGSFLTSATGTWVPVALGSASVVGTFTASGTGKVTMAATAGGVGIFAATATGTSRLPGTGTAIGTFAASGIALVTVAATGALVGTFAASGASTGSGAVLGVFAATSTGVVVLPSHATLSGAFTASAAGALAGTGQASGNFAASAIGIQTDPAFGSLVGTFTTLAVGTVTPVYPGTAAIAGSLLGQGTGLVTMPSTATMTGSFLSSATGAWRMPATGVAVGSFSASVTGLVIVPSTASALGTFTAMGTAVIPGLALGTGAIAGTFSASGTSLVTLHPTASLIGTFAGSATSTVFGPLVASGPLTTTFTANAIGAAFLPSSSALAGTFVGNASGALNKVSSGSGIGSFTATAIGLIDELGSGLAFGAFIASAAGHVNQLGSGMAAGSFSATASGLIRWNPEIATLVDDFNSGTFNPAIWEVLTAAQGGGEAVHIVNGQVSMAVVDSGVYGVLQTTGFYDLIGSAVYTQLVNAGDQSGVNNANPIWLADASCTVNGVATGNGFGWQVTDGYMVIWDFAGNSYLNIPYDPAVHKWFRVRESNGTLYFGSSSNGVTWVDLYSFPNASAGIDLTAVQLSMWGGFGSWGPAGPPTTVIFDNVNTVPVIAFTGVGALVGTFRAHAFGFFTTPVPPSWIYLDRSAEYSYSDGVLGKTPEAEPVDFSYSDVYAMSISSGVIPGPYSPSGEGGTWVGGPLPITLAFGAMASTFTSSATGAVMVVGTAGAMGDFVASGVGTVIIAVQSSGTLVGTFVASATGMVISPGSGVTSYIFTASAIGTWAFRATGSVSGAFTATAAGYTTMGYILTVTGGTLRKNYANYGGMCFTVGTNPITITALGRWVVPGNTTTHIVKLGDGLGNDISGGSVTVDTTKVPSGNAFVYMSLAAPITLAPNINYIITSLENTTDNFLDQSTFTTTHTTAGALGQAHGNTGAWSIGPGSGVCYVPTNFLYLITVGAAVVGSFAATATGTHNP